jgi:glycosyltransferase 2 family protein
MVLFSQKRRPKMGVSFFSCIISWMRKILLLLVFFLGSALVVLSFGELEQTWKTLHHSDFRFMGLGILLILVWTLNEAATYRSIYRLMDVCETLWHLVLLSSAANFVNVVAPSGGFGGVAVFVDHAGKRGNPRGLAAAAGALFLFLEYAAFMVILALGWGVYIRRNDLNPGEMTASFIMFGIFVGLGILIYIGSRSGEQLGQVLAWLSRQINRVLWGLMHKEYFHEVAALEFGMEVAGGLSILRTKHRGLVVPFLFALSGKIIQTLILMLTFLAFDVEFSIGTVVAGFASAYLFLIVSPTPYGIGIVETLLPLALTSLRVPWEQAVVVTLTYRGVTFWIPLMVGAVAFRLLQKE